MLFVFEELSHQFLIRVRGLKASFSQLREHCADGERLQRRRHSSRSLERAFA
jgi:hypothetical protein